MGHMKPGPWEKLVAEANELGIDTEVYNPEHAEALEQAVARRTAEVAREAAAQQRIIDADAEDVEDEEFAGFDEAAGATRGVLVRIVEWSEWIPVKLSPHFKGLSVANGITGFEAGEHEKVVSIETMDTNRRKRVKLDDSEEYVEYSLHVMKAVLANNVTTELLHQMIDLQGGDRDGEQPAASIVLPDHRPPNRAARRKK